MNTFHPIGHLNFNCGDVIDGFTLNGVKHGGPGGVVQTRLSLNEDLYICDIEYGMRDYRGHKVLSGLRFHLSNDTTYPENGQFGAGKLTNSMTGDICSVNPEAKGQKFRVIALSAHTGDFVDALIANVVIGFIDAPKVNTSPVRALYHTIDQGDSITRYTDITDERTKSFVSSYSQTHKISANLSAQAKFAFLASVSCGYTNTITNASQFTNELQQTLDKQESTTYTLPANNDDDVQAILQTVRGNIYNIADDSGKKDDGKKDDGKKDDVKKYIFIPDPTDNVLAITLRAGNIDVVDGLYDLNNNMDNIDTADWEYEPPKNNGGMNVVKFLRKNSPDSQNSGT